MNTTPSSMTSTNNKRPIKGYRFHPTDEELINHYLHNKILGNEDQVSAIAEVDICKHEPWDLPILSKIQSSDYVWYFLARSDYKYRNSRRANRKTKAGYWKVTGKTKFIKNRGKKKIIGIKKTLVFYLGCVPEGVKTDWVIHEYHSYFSSDGRDFSLCRLKQKSRGKINNSTIEEDKLSHDATTNVQSPAIEIEIPLSINNSTIDEGKLSHDATTNIQSPAIEIPLSEEDLQLLEELLGPDENDFSSPDAHQQEMCVEHGPQGPSVENFLHTSSLIDNYNVPSPQFGTYDVQDNTTQWMNSSTADQDVYSNDGSMPTLPYDSSPSESFGTLLVDGIEDTVEVDEWLNSCLESEFGD